MYDVIMLIDYIGVFGPAILFIISIIILLNKHIFLYLYIGGCILNIIINFILKLLIKEPRPKDDRILFELATNNGKRIEIDRYGMPSAHSQEVGFSCMYIYLVTQDIYILWAYLSISFVTMFQRFKYRSHTILQIIFGFVIGLCIGYIFFIFAKNIIKGKISSKKDDNCFL